MTKRARMGRSMARTPETVNDTMWGMGWSLRMIAESVDSIYCECGAGVDDGESRVDDQSGPYYALARSGVMIL
jgi:hypothetical protein